MLPHLPSIIVGIVFVGVGATILIDIDILFRRTAWQHSVYAKAPKFFRALDKVLGLTSVIFGLCVILCPFFPGQLW